MTEWSKGGVTLRAERPANENVLHIGAETPCGSGFASLCTGRREWIHAAGVILFALLSLRRDADLRRRQRMLRSAGRGGNFRGKGRTRRAGHGL